MISYLNPGNKVLRKMGFSNDQEGIMTRYINESGKWETHLKNTQKFILEEIEKKEAKSVALYGSGWLLDIPLDEMIHICNHIYLYDVRHPRQIMHKYRKNDKVSFIQTDLTGGLIELIYKISKKSNFAAELKKTEPSPYEPYKTVDHIFSVNVLNQLDILITEYLRKFKFYNPELVSQLRKKIQITHLKSLPAGKSSLITDYEEDLFDRTGTFVESRNLLYVDIDKNKRLKEWIWTFDSQMTYYPNRKTNFKVLAIDL